MTINPSAHGATFVLGGARSGKSRFAEELISQSGLEKIYIATGQAWDDEMKARIVAHKHQRGENWQTIEEPVKLVETLQSIDDAKCAILVDCLTLWVTNLMMAEADMMGEFAKLSAHVATARAKIVLVSNEVGLGIVPDNKMAREFRDHAGRLHQMIAAEARDVFFVAAGLSLRMKG